MKDEKANNVIKMYKQDVGGNEDSDKLIWTLSEKKNQSISSIINSSSSIIGSTKLL